MRASTTQTISGSNHSSDYEFPVFVTSDSQAPLNPNLERGTKIILLASIIVRVFLTFHRALGPDEFQHLHNSWMIHLGFLPYRDFWDNHTPLTPYLLAPILSVIGEGTQAVLVARAIFSVAGLGILWIVYKIARMLLDKSTALLAITLLSISEIFLQKSIEVRPDQMLILLWMGSIWMCIRIHPRHLIGGVLLGIASLFSPKALLCLSVALPVFCILSPATQLTIKLKRAVLYILGFLIPVTALALFFFSKGALNDLVTGTLLQNLNYPDTTKPVFLLFPQNLSFFLLAFVGMIVSFLHNRNLKHPLSLLSAAGIGLFCLLAFIMPASFPQSALIFLPIFSIFAAIAVRASLQSANILLPIIALIIGFLVPVINIFAGGSLQRSNRSQFRTIEWILKNTSAKETIFDGYGAYIFRKQAYYYGSLVQAIRERIGREELYEKIPESLEKNHCRVIISDRRVSFLPDDVQEFIRANYVTSDHQNIYIAGEKLSPENFAGARARFRIEIPAIYRIETNAKSVRIDHSPYQEPVLLNSGMHQITADQEIRFVSMVAVKDAD
jgi:Dolichyl-phosphate-mannose-protein mannosyltransferase